MPRFLDARECTPMPDAKKIDFEASLEKLEQLVEQMEDGDLSLEDSLKAFERGVKLTRDCQAALREAEQKIQLLTEENGALEAADLDGDKE